MKLEEVDDDEFAAEPTGRLDSAKPIALPSEAVFVIKEVDEAQQQKLRSSIISNKTKVK